MDAVQRTVFAVFRRNGDLGCNCVESAEWSPNRSRVVTSLMSRWKALTVEQIAVSVALAHVAGVDKRLRRLAFTTEVNSRNELQ